MFIILFFFQAEDGIRDYKVTGVQTCALPIWGTRRRESCQNRHPRLRLAVARSRSAHSQIGRASCRERAANVGGKGTLNTYLNTIYEYIQRTSKRDCLQMLHLLSHTIQFSELV